jgi:hypothetical protein
MVSTDLCVETGTVTIVCAETGTVTVTYTICGVGVAIGRLTFTIWCVGVMIGGLTFTIRGVGDGTTVSLLLTHPAVNTAISKIIKRRYFISVLSFE